MNDCATIQSSYCGLPVFVPAACFLKKEELLTFGQKVISERKDALGLEVFFESLPPRLKTGTIK